MGKHKYHRGDTSKRDILLLTCILHTRVQPPVPYSTIASYLISSSLDVAQKLAQKGAPRELRPKLAEDQTALREWLKGHLEETYNLAEDWCSDAWQVARDCDVDVVKEDLAKLGLDDVGYEVKGGVFPTMLAHVPSISRSEIRGYWTQTRDIERKHHRSSVSEGCPKMRRGSLARWAITNVTELLDTSIPVKEVQSSQNQTPSEGLKHLRNVHIEGFAKSPARLAYASVPRFPEAFVNKLHDLWSGNEDSMISQAAKIGPSQIEQGASLPRTTNTKDPKVSITPIRSLRIQERISSTEVEDNEARKWKEHQQRVNNLLQRLETVQQKYRGNSPNACSRLETEKQPHMSLPGEYSYQPQLSQIRTDFDNQLEAIETLEQLHLEDRCVYHGGLSSAMFGALYYGTAPTEGLTLSEIAGYRGDAGWIEMGNST
jgi:hypothetical protein